MVRAPRKPCCEPGCHELVPRGTSRCAVHAAQKQAEYAARRAADPTRALYRTPEWKALRQRVLEEEPWCACGCGRRSEEVDHVVTVRENPRLALVRANCRGVSHFCHVRRTRQGTL